MSNKFQNQLIRLSICISDIPKDKIKKSSSSGKLYADVVVVGRKEADSWGNDIAVYVNQTKDEQQARAEKQYCGQGKHHVFEQTFTAASESEIADIGAGATVIEPRQPGQQPPPTQDDLPF